MDCITNSAGSATILPITPVSSACPKPADLVEDIRERISKYRNFDDQRVLLSLGIDLLRRRQREKASRGQV